MRLLTIVLTVVLLSGCSPVDYLCHDKIEKTREQDARTIQHQQDEIADLKAGAVHISRAVSIAIVCDWLFVGNLCPEETMMLGRAAQEKGWPPDNLIIVIFTALIAAAAVAAGITRAFHLAHSRFSKLSQEHQATDRKLRQARYELEALNDQKKTVSDALGTLRWRCHMAQARLTKTRKFIEALQNSPTRSTRKSARRVIATKNVPKEPSKNIRDALDGI